jgi:hypothetical protein
MSEDNYQKSLKLIEILSKHQEQEVTFLSILEGIRWKFITGFGAGAALALFLSYSKDPKSLLNVWVGLPLVFILSLSSLITQIRIYGLVHCIWERIRSLQFHEATLVKDTFCYEDHIFKDFLSPHVSFKDYKISHLLTVHMACCFVFCGFIGIGSVLFIRLFGYPQWSLFLAGTCVSLILILICLRITDWYTKKINNEHNNAMNSDL